MNKNGSPWRKYSGGESDSSPQTRVGMKQYNAIFISDVHMGTKHAQVDKLLSS